MARYSEIVMDHFQSPRNWGKLDDADRTGVAGVPGQGRYLVLYLNLEGSRISQVGFQCHGCGATIAAGSMLTELIVGKSLDECRCLTPQVLLDELEGLPPDKQHCAGFAIEALRQTLS